MVAVVSFALSAHYTVARVLGEEKGKGAYVITQLYVLGMSQLRKRWPLIDLVDTLPYSDTTTRRGLW